VRSCEGGEVGRSKRGDLRKERMPFWPLRRLPFLGNRNNTSSRSGTALPWLDDLFHIKPPQTSRHLWLVEEGLISPLLILTQYSLLLPVCGRSSLSFPVSKLKGLLCTRSSASAALVHCRRQLFSDCTYRCEPFFSFAFLGLVFYKSVWEVYLASLPDFYLMCFNG
jgi:hypothetical protein